MKKLLQLIWWATVVAGIVWMLRDRLVPAPATEPDDPPHYRVAPPPAAEPDTEDAVHDDLEAVKGIGPVYAARLTEAGISSFAQLAEADAAATADAIEVGVDQVENWVAQARQRLS